MVNDLVAPLTVEDTTFPVAAHRLLHFGGLRGCRNQPAGPWLWSAGRGEGQQDVGTGLFLLFVRYSCHLDLEPALSPFESSAVLYSKCSVRVNTVLVSVCVGTHAGEKVRSIFHSAF